MKKLIICLLSVCLYFQLSNAQDNFTVIKVSGNIVIERTGYSLGIGTSFAQDENLLFKIPESRAAVINPQRGRFLLTSDNISEFKNSKSNYLPSSGKMSTRAVHKDVEIPDLKEEFENKYVFLDDNRILIDTRIYPLDEKKFFHITYDYKGSSINKKLTFKGDTLIILKNELLTVNGGVISEKGIYKMKLFYIDEDKSFLSTLICSFTPVFPDLRTLSEEVKIIVDQLKENSYEDKVNEISSFITEFYGKTNLMNLKKWLNNNLALKE